MRGLTFFLVFTAAIPFIFVSPFNGVLIWYAFSLGNFHRLAWGLFSALNYAYVIAIVTCLSWLFSRTERCRLPLTPVTVLTLVFMVWITITSVTAIAPVADVWDKWSTVEKVLFMALVCYALTNNRERIDRLIWVVVGSIAFWGVKGAIWGILHGGTEHIWGPDATAISDNNDFGLALIMVLPLLFYLYQVMTNSWIRHCLLVIGFFLVIATILTYSRGAFIGLSAMGVVLWLRSRAKVRTVLFILFAAAFIYNFAPERWFSRIQSTEDYTSDSSAMGRLTMWQIGLDIAAKRPILGGGFRITFWPDLTKRLIQPAAVDYGFFNKPRAMHSIYFDVLSEHGYVGLAIFVMITLYSMHNCIWLIRRTRRRSELLWGNLLGRMGQAILVGYWVCGAFLSQAYLDEYWCMILLVDAARRVIASELRRDQAPSGITRVHVRSGSSAQALRAGFRAG